MHRVRPINVLSCGAATRHTQDTFRVICNVLMQIQVPPQLAEVLKNYTKEVIRRQPKNLVEFSAYYFSNLASMIPAQKNCPPPTIAQIGGVYRAVANSGISRTCEVNLLKQLLLSHQALLAQLLPAH